MRTTRHRAALSGEFTGMYLHIGENQTVPLPDIVAIAPLDAFRKQTAVFLADGSVVWSRVSARTLQKRANAFFAARTV